MRSLVLAICAACTIGTVPAASYALNDHSVDQGQEQGQGQGQEQGQGQFQGQAAFGGKATAIQGQETDVRNSVDTTDFNAQGQMQKGSVDGNFSNNTTVVNPNLKTDLDSDDFRRHAESAAEVEGSESGCHTGVSAQGGVFGGSLGGASASCDAINAIRAIHLAESQGEIAIANITRANAVVRNSVRLVLSIVTLGLL
jgi:hypothetical protein